MWIEAQSTSYEKWNAKAVPADCQIIIRRDGIRETMNRMPCAILFMYSYLQLAKLTTQIMSSKDLWLTWLNLEEQMARENGEGGHGIKVAPSCAHCFSETPMNVGRQGWITMAKFQRTQPNPSLGKLSWSQFASHFFSKWKSHVNSHTLHFF